MPTHNLARTVVRDAARMAGKLCLAVRAEMLQNPSYMEKAGKEPVTIADYGAQAVVLHHVSQRFPADCTLAEERAGEFIRLTTANQQHRIVHHVSEIIQGHASLNDISEWLDIGCDSEQRDRVWVVDPIDGTKGFLRGEHFAVAVALLIEGKPILGALACPLLPSDPARPDVTDGIIAVAVEGLGATVEPLNGGTERAIRVSDIVDISKARVVESVEAGHTDHDFNEGVLAKAGVKAENIVRIDSQAKYAAVASGNAEIYIRQSHGSTYREKVWDHAAGYLLVKEAGGVITDLDGKQLDFSLGERLQNNRGVLATNHIEVHKQVLKAIQMSQA